jgi:HEAT repeat protein
MRSRTLQFVLLSASLLPVVSPGQAANNSYDKVDVAIAQLKSGNFTLATVEQIAEANAAQAIPALKEQFALSQDASSKAKIADALLRLGDKDDAYWNYLVEQATEAIHRGIPLPMVYDSHGSVVRGQVSSEFASWAKDHDVSPEIAAQDVTFSLPGKVAMLGETGDPRGIPLLREALHSPNLLIAAMAAKGLALIQDTNSIPLIIEACSQAPSDGAKAIADSLIYFNDPQAQTAADRFLPKEHADAMREARARGKGPFHY